MIVNLFHKLVSNFILFFKNRKWNKIDKDEEMIDNMYKF